MLRTEHFAGFLNGDFPPPLAGGRWGFFSLPGEPGSAPGRETCQRVDALRPLGTIGGQRLRPSLLHPEAPAAGQLLLGPSAELAWSAGTGGPRLGAVVCWDLAPLTSQGRLVDSLPVKLRFVGVQHRNSSFSPLWRSVFRSSLPSVLVASCSRGDRDTLSFHEDTRAFPSSVLLGDRFINCCLSDSRPAVEAFPE